MFGENFDGKYHSVDEGTSKDITSLTLNLENGKKFLDDYLSNHKIAAENLAKKLVKF